MRKIFAFAILIHMVLFSGILHAETPVYFGFDLSANGKYVWRGMPYNTEAVLWPDAWISWKGFTGTIWGSIDLTDVKDEQWTMTDIFLFLDYSHSFDKLDLSIGYAHYIFPGYDDFFPTTGEIYGKVGTDFGIFQASLAAYVDLIEAKGLYVTPEISRSFTFDNFTTTLSVSLGFAEKNHNAYYFYTEKSGFTDLALKLGISFSPKGTLGNFMSLNGNLNYSTILDKELADVFEDRSYFWWGIGISFFFGGE